MVTAGSYAVTIIANTVRISSALWLNESRPGLIGLDRDEIHRLDGIVIYFGFLLILFVIGEKLHGRTKMNIKTFLFPLVIYYSVTLAVPIANGALRQGTEFWQHAAFVLATPIVFIVVVAVPLELFSRYSKRKDVSAVSLFSPTCSTADEVGTRANVRDAAAFSHRTIGLKCSPVVADR